MSQNDCVLFLHFDVNKTIIMSDVASGKDLIGTINSLLSECTWGSFPLEKNTEDRTPHDWSICHNEPVLSPPVANAVTYGTYLEDYTGTPKKERVRIKNGYTESGCIGERFRPYFDILQETLRIDKAQSPVPVPLGPDTRDVDEPFHSGYYHILPSFFKMIEYLVSESTEFRILFRTFGTDIANVAREFNLFCEGRHPYHRSSLPHKLDGSDPLYRRDLRLHLPQASGCLRRTGDGSTDVHLAYVDRDKAVRVASGHSQVDSVLLQSWFGLYDESVPSSSSSSSSTTMTAATTLSDAAPFYVGAIQDDFRHWHEARGEADDAGKLFMVNHRRHSNTVSPPAAAAAANGRNRRLVEVFFDDNIERDRAHIVDVRDRVSFMPVPFTEANGRYLRRVEPFAAITDRDYFVNQVKDIIQTLSNGVELEV